MDTTVGESESSTASSDAAEATTAADSRCGDGVVDPEEACDDGNEVDGDGCSRDCILSGTQLWSLELVGRECRSVSADLAGNIYVLSADHQIERDPGLVSQFDASSGAPGWSTELEAPLPGGTMSQLFGSRRGSGFRLLGWADGTGMRGSWLQARDGAGALSHEQAGPEGQFVRGLVSGSDDDLWLFAEVYVDGEVEAALERIADDGSLVWHQELNTSEGLYPWYQRGYPHLDGDMILRSSPAAVTRLRPTGEQVWTTPMELDYQHQNLEGPAVTTNGEVFVSRSTVSSEVDGTLEILRYSGDGSFLDSFAYHAPDVAPRWYGNGYLAADAFGGLLVAADLGLPSDEGGVRWSLARYSDGGDSAWAHLIPPLESAAYENALFCGVFAVSGGPIVVAINTLDGPEYTTSLHAFEP